MMGRAATGAAEPDGAWHERSVGDSARRAEGRARPSRLSPTRRPSRFRPPRRTARAADRAATPPRPPASSRTASPASSRLRPARRRSARPAALRPAGYGQQPYGQPGYGQPPATGSSRRTAAVRTAGSLRQRLPPGLRLPPEPRHERPGHRSMILGIIWIYWIGSILAVIFGHIALNQIKKTGQNGRGMADRRAHPRLHRGRPSLVVIIVIAGGRRGHRRQPDDVLTGHLRGTGRSTVPVAFDLRASAGRLSLRAWGAPGSRACASSRTIRAAGLRACRATGQA